ncbi:guanine nucleotide binding protein-like 2 (nucleolar), isoform CRA_c [Rattus norvegicus]|uniref:Guanine nucleotide binding protein-like 2 (Nucleolar), isoform CRA_c n=1 Tax=Rattus norvegicus TaxID=10116 RepID=A6IS71_RAT|nr:guanine nucleotide binding protein-like 2 (nucleolar), isoform CRA_c [Rattus norvegicus]
MGLVPTVVSSVNLLCFVCLLCPAPTKRARKWNAQVEEEPSDKTQRMLTCKERRRAARQQQSKKVGVRYYETHNVKNRNRNKKKTNDSEGQKHRHKKFRQKQ